MSEYKEEKITTDPDKGSGRTKTFKSTQLIWLIFGLIEGLLGLRFLFKLISVNPNNAFASLLYSITDVLLAPFSSLTSSPSAGGIVFEFSTLIAIAIYALVGWALERLIYVIFYKPGGTVTTERKVISQETTSEDSPTQPTKTED